MKESYKYPTAELLAYAKEDILVFSDDIADETDNIVEDDFDPMVF